MNNKLRNTIIMFVGLAVVVFMVTFGIIALTQNTGKPDNQVSEEKAIETMDRLYKKIRVTNLPLVKGNVDLSEADIKQDLPDINEKYPAQVVATTADYIELFSSTEKATDATTDRWLIDIAESFNRSGETINGKPISVQIRGIASGAGMDYILSGKHMPDAYTPSNELWGDAISAAGIKTELIEKRLVGNVAGIVLSKEKNDEVATKYGSISMKTITEAVTAGELNFGYTNPFASSTGINFLLSTLYSFNPSDPLSNDAISAFEAFQANVPFVAYTTLQMKEAAKSGALDGFIFEAQQFANTPDFANYIFTPFGARHDNPVFSIGELSSEKREILNKFITYCKSDSSQAAATRYGFNQHDNYICELTGLTGNNLTAAQKIYKEKKNKGREIVTVFVADVSGSMDGAPLNQLKESLLKSAKFINSDSQVGLVTFSSDVNIAVPIGLFDINNRSLFAGAVENMSASGSTAMYDAIVVAEKMLQEAKANNPNAKPMLFVLTDGETNVGSGLNQVRSVIAGLKIPVYTIGYNADIKALTEISGINEAASINADTSDVVYQLQNLFMAEF